MTDEAPHDHAEDGRWQAGDALAERYVLIELLGNGNFGEVWLAEDLTFDRKVALKLLDKYSESAIAYDEATDLERLRGDNVLRVLDAGTASDVPYLATDVAVGGSLEDLLERQEGGLAPHLAVRYVRHALSGLAAAHAAGLLHRDVKPSNIFLDRDDWARLGDFGVAHELSDDGHAPLGGDLFVCAPEALLTGQASVVSDVYSAGVSLFRLLTGEWPFEADTPEATEALITSSVAPNITDLAPHVSQRLADRVRRAMSSDPDRRFRTAQEMAAALADPGVVTRSWADQAPHSGHLRCFSEQGAHRRFSVCVVVLGNRLEIETSHLSGRKLRALCSGSIRQGELAKELRRVFRVLDKR